MELNFAGLNLSWTEFLGLKLNFSGLKLIFPGLNLSWSEFLRLELDSSGLKLNSPQTEFLQTETEFPWTETEFPWTGSQSWTETEFRAGVCSLAREARLFPAFWTLDVAENLETP